MKKLRRFFRGLKLSYYSLMMGICEENNTAECMLHGDNSDEAIYWVRKHDLYLRKYEKTLMKTV